VRKILGKLIRFVKTIFFYSAFAGYILVQILLLGLLLAAIQTIWLSDFLLALFFIGLLTIGAGSYFVFRRIRQEREIRAEAERWLAERQHPDPRHLQSRKTIKRWALWIPTVTVVLACSFFDGMWAFGSHLLHPGRGRLIGYEVSIPLNWTIRYSDLDGNGSVAHSIVVAERYRGLLRAGSSLYIGRRLPFSVSAMNFRSTPGGDPLAPKPVTTIISERAMPFGKSTIVCHEEVPPRWMTSTRYINCSTPTGDFSGYFNGSSEDAPAFYRTLESVKLTK
jgi:hypothetical protein